MTKDQLLFKQMVEQFPDLAGYWDFEEQKVKVISVEDLP